MNQQLLPHTKESAEHTLDLINSWINTIDTKASYALSLTSILTGFILIQGVPQAFSSFVASEKISFSVFASAILVALLYIFSYSAICLLLIAIMARVTPKSNANSHLFFWHISKWKLQQYTKEFTTLTEAEYVNELLEQIHTNSNICSKKSTYYQRGIYTLLVAITLCFICCIFQLI